MPEIIQGIAFESAIGVEKLVSKIEVVKPRNKKTDSFLQYFYELGTDGRGYEEEARQLVTVDKKSKVLDSKRIASNSYGVPTKCQDGRYRSVTFLNDSVLEVKGNYYDNESDLNYYSMTLYTYFEISALGKISEIAPNNHFAMASVVKLSDRFFEGCFAARIDTYDSDDEQEFNTISTSHLSLFDLQYMINEIYARHGLIFKDPQWKSIFQQKKWYKGNSTNVDAKITALEKANIQFIKSYANKMKSDEKAYTKPEQALFYDYP